MDYTMNYLPEILEEGDTVTFIVAGVSYLYHRVGNFMAFDRAYRDVGARYGLASPLGGNDTIFGVLGLHKGEYCEDCYEEGIDCFTGGVIDGNWPEPNASSERDSARYLTQVVCALLRLCMSLDTTLLDMPARLANPAKDIQIILLMHRILFTMGEKMKRYAYRHKFAEADRNFAEYCLRPYLATGLLEKVTDPERTWYHNREPKALREILSRFNRTRLDISLMS